MLTTLLAQGTPTSPSENRKQQAEVIYATCLTSQGNAVAAIPILEKALAVFQKHPLVAHDKEYVSYALANAYDAAGREQDALNMFPSQVAHTGTLPVSDRGAYDYRERWGQFLLDHGHLDQAQSIFDLVISDAPRWLTLTPSAARAWAGKARIALAHRNLKAADSESKVALEALDKVQQAYDVRIKTELMSIRSSVLLALGKSADAEQLAKVVLEDMRRFDAPESPSIRKAKQLFDLASQMTAGSVRDALAQSSLHP